MFPLQAQNSNCIVPPRIMSSAKTLEAFGHYLRRRRIELGLTQAELAERGGISQTYISDLERFANTSTPKTPRRPTIPKIAQGLGVPIAEVEDAAHLQKGAVDATRREPAKPFLPPPGMTPITLSSGEIWFLRADEPDPRSTIRAVEAALAAYRAGAKQ